MCSCIASIMMSTAVRMPTDHSWLREPNRKREEAGSVLVPVWLHEPGLLIDWPGCHCWSDWKWLRLQCRGGWKRSLASFAVLVLEIEDPQANHNIYVYCMIGSRLKIWAQRSLPAGWGRTLCAMGVTASGSGLIRPKELKDLAAVDTPGANRWRPKAMAARQRRDLRQEDGPPIEMWW